MSDPYITTVGGYRYYLLNPDPKAITVRAVMTGLMQLRWNGHNEAWRVFADLLAPWNRR